jgi:pimeloyl-ACP methyl ester carboxylesterase
LVVVAHSWGGYDARVFRYKYPDDVSGMVLVDAGHEDLVTLSPDWRDMEGSLKGHDNLVVRLAFTALPRLLGWCGGGPPDGAAVANAIECRPDELRAILAYDNGRYESMDQARTSGTLGTLPLVVLSHDSAVGMSGEGALDPLAKGEPAWAECQRRLARLSTRALHQVLQGVSHDIPNLRPDAVVEAIHAVIDMPGRVP